ncbi:MAG: ATP-binding cassette domain-containing protein [Cytophagales bacterium]|nr:ATP-binding cassette domain-containing protein [Cytophagales bacterium]
MSVEVKNLSKQFGTQKAVNEISFEVKKGEILGFLGPNGAGKSTTMKMIAGILASNSGSVTICGEYMTESSVVLKKKIGYLPENNPLYNEMYVHEYLNFASRLCQIPDKKAALRIKEIIELCGLTLEQNKKIGTLSKGYKQRVGLAQALIHDPEVLILDEPTTGLDPNQLTEIRDLIRSVSKNKTVIFSSHIMQEVEAVCTRALIINRGKIVADQRIADLKKKAGATCCRAVYKNELPDSFFEGMPFISRFQRLENGEILLHTCNPSTDLTELVFRHAVEQKQVLIELTREKNTLEDVFQQLTLAPAKPFSDSNPAS